MNLCMSTGSRENKQNKVRTQLWDTLYVNSIVNIYVIGNRFNILFNCLKLHNYNIYYIIYNLYGIYNHLQMYFCTFRF